MESSDSLLRAELMPFYTTFGSTPSDYVVIPPSGFDSVGDVILSLTDGGSARCTGSLIHDRFILTAAHCVTDMAGNLDVNGATITFNSGDILNSSQIFVHPDWDGDFYRGNDIALIKTAEIAPTTLDRYNIFTGDPASFFKVAVNKSGYGLSGNGNVGATLPSGTHRSGQNEYDAYADVMLAALGVTDFVPESVLQYDFDNGIEANDAFDFFFGSTGLGLGENEVSAAPGDSGGPTFAPDGSIMRVTSYGIVLSFTDGGTSDILPGLNSSFGEFAGDTNVALYANWVNGVLDMPMEVPEPGTVIALSGLGLGLLLSKKRNQN